MSSDLDLIDRGTIDFSGIDKELFETTDLGKFGEHMRRIVTGKQIGRAHV